jgi:hypothetical protein
MGVYLAHFVGLQQPHLDLPISTAKYNFVGAIFGPHKTRHCCGLEELVADALFVSPVRAQPGRCGHEVSVSSAGVRVRRASSRRSYLNVNLPVDEHNVVALCDRQLGGVG